MTARSRPRTVPHDSVAAAPIRTRRVSTPIGDVELVASTSGLRAIRFVDEPAAAAAEPGAHPSPSGSGGGDDVLDRVAYQLAEYFAGVRTRFDLPLDVVHGTAFQRSVWEALATIPFGVTWSYAQQASAVGRPRAVRAVGAANGRNPVPIVVPCHRVVGADGSLTGYAGGVARKRWLLDHERRIASASDADDRSRGAERSRP